ncbi:choice-of-anchor J domain-containing protein [Winogradskyella sp. SYSU M77433]|uniref:T9SS-dependent choice-of-anchor J family protein n=1 Tax=Winogradskyella sp. SYSU M77433 TaxID=3042722 RepID=UPI002480AE42|nr:choice-of-anchor J domain-containing protein [Winogradskyella sp. SYSU M77433]MDH7911534.1 choice-of-anchor J domain-containing protein [Winogradskyella sp. SYSU M77433]
MKNFYSFLFALLISGLGFGQVIENFDFNFGTSYSNYVHNDFQIINGLSESSSNSLGSTGRSVRLRNSGSPSLEYIGPDGNGLDGGVGTISFWYRHWDGSPAISTINIEYSIDNGNYINIGTINNFSSTTYSQFSYTLNNTSENIKVRITSSGEERFIIDQFEITAPTSGPSNPDTFSASPSSSTQIDLAYDDNTSEDNVIILFNTDNAFTTPSGAPTAVGTSFAGGTILVNSNGTGTYNHTGLSENTTYYYMAYSYDGAEYSTGLSGEATTPCSAISSFPFTEGFESGVPPTCWTSYRGTNNEGTSEDWTSSSDANSGSVAAVVSDENAGVETEDWLVTSPLDLSVLSNTTLSFYSKNSYDNDYGTEYSIRVSTTSQTDHGSFSVVETYTETDFNNVAYTQQIVDLSAYDGQTIYIAFVQTQNWGDSWYLDDIEVYEAISSDNDSEVYESSPQISATSIVAADVTTSGSSEDVFSFIIEDFGTSDGLPTNVTTMRFVPGANNSTDWSNAIAGITLYDENLVDYTPFTTITDTEIILNFASPIVIANGTALEFFLGIYLNTTNIIDNSVIQVQINESSSGFSSDNSGSGFSDPFLLGDIIGNNITIDVEATEIIFSEQPTETIVNEIMDSVSITAVDTNGNVDLGYTSDISVTSTGTLSSTPVTVAAANGVATFSNLTHTATGTALTLTASDDLFTDVVSEAFNIIEVPVGATDLFISEYIEGSASNKYIEIYNGTGANVILTDYSVELYSNGATSPTNTEDFTSGFPSTLADGEVIVLRNNSANIHGSLTTYTSTVVNFNGNDAIVLKHNGTIIDIFGNIGCDPGSYWSGSSNTTQDETLIRNSNICGGILNDSGSNCPFSTLDSEWTSFPQDDVSNLGVHTANCGPTTYTYNDGVWSPSNPDGTSTASENIVIESGNATISSDTNINSITVNPGAGLTIDSEVILTVNDVLLLESTSTSYSSLIVNGTVTGTVNYSRYINSAAESGTTTGDNDLISAPLTGQTFGDFKTANPNILSGTIGDVGPYYLFGPFDTSNNEYVLYYDTDNDASTLDAGVGYRTGSNGGGPYTFTGNVETTDVTVSIQNETQSNWNLIGNPYPSYISLSDFLTENSSLFDTYSSGVYGYNGADSNPWVVWNNAYALANPGAVIAPGQGFYVSSLNENSMVTFNSTSRTFGSTDDFIAGRSTETVSNITLSLSNNSSSFSTDFYFTEFSTQGLDPGYDSSLYSSTIPSFAIYSHLVTDNTGIPMAIQSLGETDYNNVTIPLGVNANQGEQITFSITTNTIPANIDIYLEDTVENTSTLLTYGDYTLTPNTTLNGTGRFFLNFVNSTLSTINNDLETLNIYTNQGDDTIVIQGQLTKKTTVNIYDIQGRIIQTTQLLNTKNSQSIDASSLSNGVYIVELNNNSQTKTQKVILR